MSDPKHKILYCRCAYAKVVPDEVKNEVLEKLCSSGATFECVADLCEMSARKDPQLQNLIDSEEDVKIIACYHRAVKWLFHSAGHPFPEENNDRIEVLNMREQSAEEIMDELTS
ncbi:MAG: hypothetical protein L3J39_11620 [Verrucomicrobiales bacterium]|nr:hypothetical protein [Verrucomicrobiales bacterium]